MNATISLDGILQSLSMLSGDNKRWLAAHLMEQAEAEERGGKADALFEQMTTELWQLPMDNTVTTEEIKHKIRSSRMTGTRRLTPMCAYGEL